MQSAGVENGDAVGIGGAMPSVGPVFAGPDRGRGRYTGEAAPRVLVCEDDWLIAMTIEDVLSDAGVDVVGVAPDAETALALLEDEQPDFVLMDIRLQGGDDGIALAARLWRDHGLRSLFVSGNIDDGARRAAGPARPLGFLSKPFSPEELLAAVKGADPQSGGQHS